MVVNFMRVMRMGLAAKQLLNLSNGFLKVSGLQMPFDAKIQSITVVGNKEIGPVLAIDIESDLFDPTPEGKAPKRLPVPTIEVFDLNAALRQAFDAGWESGVRRDAISTQEKIDAEFVRWFAGKYASSRDGGGA